MSKKNIAKSVYRKGLLVSSKILGVKTTKELDARIRFHRKLNLSHPQTLADKVSWLELNTDQTLPTRLTDKYAVRSFVKEKGLESILIPLCGGAWTAVEEIDFDSLPESFVLKATHGCAMNLIVPDKSLLDVEETKKVLNHWLHEDYPRACIEPHYKGISHRLYAEEMLDTSEGIIDYKIHCINGEPRFILCCSERDTQLHESLFNIDWEPLLNHLQKVPIADPLPDKPSELAEMLRISRILSEDFPFVRVDLYQNQGKIYFGEMTFSPASGVFEHFDDSFIEKWGKELDLSSCEISK